MNAGRPATEFRGALTGQFFATADLLGLAKERSWLMKAATAIIQHWHKQNARK
jgi:hypothetical protein